MIPEAEAVEFIDTMSRKTGILLSIGLNAYYAQPDPGHVFNLYIDPTSLDEDSESTLEHYVEKLNYTIEETWNDWGRFLKISKPQRLTAAPRPA